MKDDRRASIRLFFALWPQEHIRSALVQARAGGVDGARPTHPQDLHMTLVFIGDVDPDLLPCIETAGDDVALAAFELTLERVETWPRQRLLAAAPHDPPPALFNLVSQLQQNLLPCGIQPEPRRYRPHVTLARKAARKDPAPVAIPWPVQDFVLARSGAAGPGNGGGYQVLRSWQLD
ncbi:RNA 2',3'-cyclic phosphodiesterase [Thiohalocapsa halophila]|uniref:RNA 2',3'-cyclic phosphodiesterase n=1 Tax=Thiohalocapsa halophila TaxID=69359 RepID=A0ABS1CFR6_9GAMM|nr:RNA 2',3'-cyclic phosphodiesterase [Thiohalocapsa halophila]MBK1630751.1 RNA 2',3'-cyclic phosphodiesterase [Thiohalocapsa halophila]